MPVEQKKKEQIPTSNVARVLTKRMHALSPHRKDHNELGVYNIYVPLGGTTLTIFVMSSIGHPVYQLDDYSIHVASS